jgi:hypothetical protein
LWGRELLTQPHQRAQQPVQRGERQRCLDLKALSAQHQCLTSVTDELLEKGRLADAGLTSNHQAARRPVPRLFDELGQASLFEPAAD